MESTVNLRLMSKRLYEAPGVLFRICADYGFTALPGSPEELVEALWAEFGQTPVEDPLLEIPDNQAVFEAAVRSLGSNSRAWAEFLRLEPTLRKTLFDYDPERVARAHVEGLLGVEELRPCFKGQSSTNDSLAVLRWAERLSSGIEFHQELRALGNAFQSAADKHLSGGLHPGEMFLCVVGFLGSPPTPSRCAAHPYLPEGLRARSAEDWKLPGMQYALTSEMLRNLRWDGYKADRHIMRLLSRWVPDVLEDCRERAGELAGLVGTRNQDLLKVLSFSLAGMAIAPENVPRSHVDNLIWALAAYVEKKGAESETDYLLR